MIFIVIFVFTSSIISHLNKKINHAINRGYHCMQSPGLQTWAITYLFYSLKYFHLTIIVHLL
jgi:hypothetical protein